MKFHAVTLWTPIILRGIFLPPKSSFSPKMAGKWVEEIDQFFQSDFHHPAAASGSFVGEIAVFCRLETGRKGQAEAKGETIEGVFL